MKAFTDLSQSKKLTEILPFESADMFYRSNSNDVKLMWEHLKNIPLTTPCWSLTALFDVLPQHIKLPQDTHDAYNNPTYKGETYSFSIERHGLFGDKWFSRYNGKHKRQFANRYERVYIDLFKTKDYDNPVDACYEMILKLSEQKLL